MASAGQSPTTQRKSNWLWLALIPTLGLSLIAFVLFNLNRDIVLPASWAVAGGARDSVADLLNALIQHLLIPVAVCLFGILIERSQPGNRIGWILIFTGLTSATAEALSEYAIRGNFPTVTGLPGADIAAWVTNWIWLILIALVFFTVALFPSGYFLSRNWKRLIAALLITLLVAGFLSAGLETPMSSAFQIPNPFVTNRFERTQDWFYGAAVVTMIIITVVLVTQMLARFRRSTGMERKQIQWLLAGVILFALMILAGLALNVGGPNSFAVGTVKMPNSFNALGGILVDLSPLALLLGIGIAMLRYQLYDIEFIIRRTTGYAVVTGLLALVYFSIVVVSQRLFTDVSGQTSPIIVVLSTLLIAALFLPLRRRVQNAIDRRFFRRKYDAEKVLNAFATRVRDETDLDALTAELVRVIQETMQPEFVSVWLAPIGEDGRGPGNVFDAEGNWKS